MLEIVGENPTRQANLAGSIINACMMQKRVQEAGENPALSTNFLKENVC